MLNNLNISDIKIIGAGNTGFELAKLLRAQNKEIKITLIDKSAHYFDKAKFIRTLDFKDYIDLQDFCRKETIGFIQDKVERINPERKKIYFKQNEPLDYELLVIATGLKSKDVSIKGEHREGLFYLSEINYFEAKNLLKISSEIIVYASTMLGLELSVSLKNLGKHVRIISESLDFLGNYQEQVVGVLNEKGIALNLGVRIDEVIGEGQIRATKVNPLKVFSSQLVFVDSKFTANIDFFETALNLTNTFNTPYENLYVIGDVTRGDIENETFYAFNQEECLIQANAFTEFILESKPFNFERKITTDEQKDKIINEFLVKVKNLAVESSAANQG